VLQVNFKPDRALRLEASNMGIPSPIIASPNATFKWSSSRTEFQVAHRPVL